MTTYIEAYDIMAGHIKDSLPADFHIIWPDLPDSHKNEAEYARVTVKYDDRRQRSFGGRDGTRRFEAYGLLSVQLSAQVGDGNTALDTRVQKLVRALEDARSPLVCYRNIRAISTGKDGGYNTVNVLTNFEFTDIH